MSRAIKTVLVANLIVIAVLVFLFPHLMVSPGPLIDGHRDYETDCFACHKTFIGAEPEKCVGCHKVNDIGVLTTKGKPVAVQRTKVPFHQKLLGQDCIACHSDHQGVAKYRIRQRFSHGLLDASDREQCEACHRKPEDALHGLTGTTCVQCHGTEKWKPARFDHKMLTEAGLQQCVSCHKAKMPNDTLHVQGSDNCGVCHGTERWKPATFNHAKLFVLDGHHERCTTCHRTKDYKQYTCYFCHEHSEANIRQKHLKEGIRDYENCVACHRSADEREAKRAWESIRRGVPYQFQGGSGIEPEKKRKRKKDHDDD
ncbi:MAG: cytochrome c3 family protein [Magnetospirillum sp. WYHS-4]